MEWILRNLGMGNGDDDDEKEKQSQWGARTNLPR